MTCHRRDWLRTALTLLLLGAMAGGAGCSGHDSGPRPTIDGDYCVGSLHRHELQEVMFEGEKGLLSPGSGGRAMVEHEFAAERLFNEALVSWNVDVPAGSMVRVDVQARRADTGEWSPWLYVGRWGEDSWPLVGRVQDGGWCQVDIDYLKCSQMSDRLRVRVTGLWKAGGTDSVRIESLSACLSEIVDGRPSSDPRENVMASVMRQTPAPAKVLAVPFRSQKVEDPSLAGRICSPTSVSMVMAYWGVNVPTGEVAARCLDTEFDIHGNWPRNVQAAHSYGLRSQLVRFSTWKDVERTIANGTPLIMSIYVKPGELPEAPYPETDGHLLVLCGFDERGDLVVNDPACGSEKDARRVYPRGAMTMIWLQRCRGTAYLIESASSPTNLPGFVPTE